MARLDRIALWVVAGWCVWVFVSTGLAGRPLVMALPYLVPPLVGVAGVIAGRFAAGLIRTHPDVVSAGLAVVAWAFVLGWAITPEPGKLLTTYPNANSAVGVQLVALVGLVWLGRPRAPVASAGGGANPGAGTDTGAGETNLSRWTTVALSAAGVGALLVIVLNDSVAGTALALPVLAVTVVCAWSGRGPWRRLGVLSGALILLLGAAAHIALARASAWPALAERALSTVRKQLWTEALSLWGRHPVTGGGAGSFREVNPLAEDADLVRAHSSTLQVAAEFGWIGLALFAAMLGLGLLLPLRGSRAAATIAIAAWVALGLHSYVDHLYEFPAVMFAAAAVLGWATRSGTARGRRAISPAPGGARAHLPP